MKIDRKLRLAVLFPVLALSCTLAWTEEVVRFQDGRYLEIQNHQVYGAAVKLTLGNESILILPLDRVERIRRGQVQLYPAPDEQPLFAGNLEEEPAGPAAGKKG